MTAKNRKGFFYINQETESKVLENFGTSDIKELEKIVKEFLINGKTNASDLDDLDIIYKQKRIESLTKKNLRLDIQNRLLLVHDMKFSPSDAVEIASGRKELDCIDVIRCPDCNWSADKTRTNQIDSLIYHLKDVHNRTPTEDE